ncbi:glycine--tRNA ligase subunit beta, partial [bacterium]|nr:glycine--tRNA ligase subunit beta [bacterium]
YLADGEFTLDSASLDDYKRRCAGMYVILDGTTTDEDGVVIPGGAGERYLILKEQVEGLLAKYGEQGYDRALLLDVCNMVEHPTCLEGEFEERFLDLPESVVVSTLREYQKYFEVRDDKGELLPRFIAVRDGAERGAETVIAGHERVVRARLTDASYFWEEAKKKPLDELTEELDGLSFIKGLGSYGDKRQRLLKLIETDLNLGGVDKAELRRAIELAKQDLLTPLVVEFTSLQGVIGGELARRHGEPEAVADAIAEQYKPAGFTGDPKELPKTAVGAMLSLLDKLDTLAGCFAIGREPSGSADPFGLRRAARGILGIAMGIEDHQSGDLKLSELDLSPLISTAVEGFVRNRDKQEMAMLQLMAFMRVRTERLFVELGASLKATRAAQNLDVTPTPDEQYQRYMDEGVPTPPRMHVFLPTPHVVWHLAKALTKAEGSEDFANVAAGFKRARNILLKAKGTTFGTLAPDKLVEEAEKGLYNWLEENETAVDGFIRIGKFTEAISLIAQSRSVIDRFFEEVMVMAEDESLRNNRLALLERMVRLFRRVGDLSQMA